MIAPAIPLPLFAQITCKLPGGVSIDVPAEVAFQWKRLGLEEKVRGKKIGIGIGSRGIAAIDAIARALVDGVKASGGEPFIIPAMGSHGGATPEGQLDVLASLGVTEASMGCSIRATMETVILGQTSEGLPVHFDRYAAEADGLIIANRVKLHTDFHGPTESGLHKMLAIGLGKEKGAVLVHSRGVEGLKSLVRPFTEVILDKINFLAGFAVVEDGYHRPAHLRALTGSELSLEEPALLDLARKLSPKLPVEDIDVLVVDRMGKEISGTGMDTNVLGRMRIPGISDPDSPHVKTIAVLDLTDASHGNALGVGIADFTTRRLLNKVDFNLMTKNVYTAGLLERAFIPLVLDTDLEAIQCAIGHAYRLHPERASGARIVRIASTLDLEKIWVSANLADEIAAKPECLTLSEPTQWRFQEGNLF